MTVFPNTASGSTPTVHIFNLFLIIQLVSSLVRPEIGGLEKEDADLGNSFPPMKVVITLKTL